MLQVTQIPGVSGLLASTSMRERGEWKPGRGGGVDKYAAGKERRGVGSYEVDDRIKGWDKKDDFINFKSLQRILLRL